MKTDFTAYVRSLASDGTPPDEARFEAVLAALAAVLAFEMRQRSLWHAPPSWLGVVGGRSWDEKEVFEELLLDCYEFVFVRRLRGLRGQLVVRDAIDGLVFRSVRNFLHDLQRRHDPLGYRVFEVVHAAVGRLVERGVLTVVAGDPRLRNDTVLAFRPGAPRAAEVDLAPLAARWAGELLPELVTARELGEIAARLAERLATLPAAEVEVVCFRDVVEPLKDAVRSRWSALGREADEETATEGGGETATVVRLVRPELGFEERQAFARLVDCVEDGLEGLPARRKTREHLERFWLYLRGCAADAEETSPSDRQLGELLAIPRARLPELRSTMGELVARCREAGAGRAAATAVAGASSGARGETRMSHEERRHLLRVRTAEAARATAPPPRAPGAPLRQGDLFVMPGEPAGVEWVVLEAEPGGGLVAAPVDDHPLVGSRDVATGDERAVRCGLATRIAPASLGGATVTGTLAAAPLERARQRRAEIVADTLAPSARALAVDADSEYRAWTAELAAVQPAAGARVLVHPAARRWAAPALALAALVLLAVALVLLVVVRRERAELERRLSIPQVAVNLPFEVLSPDETLRGGEPLRVPAGQERFVLILDVTSPEPWASYRLLVRERSTQREVRRFDDLVLSRDGLLSLELARGVLPSGEWVLEVWGVGDGKTDRLHRYLLRLEVD